MFSEDHRSQAEALRPNSLVLETGLLTITRKRRVGLRHTRGSSGPELGRVSSQVSLRLPHQAQYISSYCRLVTNRLFAFCIMTALYISLFFFLRRPDTISIGDISSKNHSSWTDNLKQLAFRGCKKAQPKEEDVPPWEKLQLDFSGVVILPEPASAATRKPSVASVINVITRSPVRLTSLFKVNSKERPTALNDQPINGSACPAELTVMPTVDHGLNIRFPAEVDHEYPASAKSIHEAEQNGQTLEAFFKADEKAFVPASTLPGLPSSEAMAESASAYFNRQASLLMFWFPIAYTITLTPSLVRLSAEIARGRDSPTLKLIANLATNSLGLQDVFIYGIVEWTIKRRVRQRLPGRL